MNPYDMRSIIDAISESTITEAPLSQKIKNGITKVKAGLGSNRAKGEVDVNELANKLDTAYNQYLGRTGKSGTIQDLASFLISPSVGFGKSDVENILKPTLSSMFRSSEQQEPVQQEQPQTQNPPPENEQQNDTPNQNPEPEQVNEPSSENQTQNQKSEEQNSEPNEADDFIEEAINQILTYTNRKYAENMSPETGNKLRRAVLTIANNIADASPNMIKKGGNAALDGVAVLDNSGLIDAGQNGRIQDYINAILNMDVDDEKPAFNEKPINTDSEEQEPVSQDNNEKPDSTDNVDTNTDDETTPEEESKNKTKPKVTLSSTGKKPKVRMPATTESINESYELSDKDVYNIFKSAAQYAYTNNLVGGGNTYEPGYQNSPRSSSYSQQNRSTSGFDGNYVGLDKQDQRFMDKINNRLRNMGISNDEFNSRLDLARIDAFDSIQNPGDVRSLAAIGYAFLKSIPK